MKSTLCMGRRHYSISYTARSQYQLTTPTYGLWLWL